MPVDATTLISTSNWLGQRSRGRSCRTLGSCPGGVINRGLNEGSRKTTSLHLPRFRPKNCLVERLLPLRPTGLPAKCELQDGFSTWTEHSKADGTAQADFSVT